MCVFCIIPISSLRLSSSSASESDLELASIARLARILVSFGRNCN